jgi:hypothetical protein
MLWALVTYTESVTTGRFYTIFWERQEFILGVAISKPMLRGFDGKHRVIGYLQMGCMVHSALPLRQSVVLRTSNKGDG